jgi:hypothetical protein
MAFRCKCLMVVRLPASLGWHPMCSLHSNVNPLRFHYAEERLVAARDAIAQLCALPMADASSQFVLQHTMGDLDEAARLFEDAHLLFIKLENLLTIVEWQIERLSPQRRPDGAGS